MSAGLGSVTWLSVTDICDCTPHYSPGSSLVTLRRRTGSGGSCQTPIASKLPGIAWFLAFSHSTWRLSAGRDAAVCRRRLSCALRSQKTRERRLTCHFLETQGQHQAGDLCQWFRFGHLERGRVRCARKAEDAGRVLRCGKPSESRTFLSSCFPARKTCIAATDPVSVAGAAPEFQASAEIWKGGKEKKFPTWGRNQTFEDRKFESDGTWSTQDTTCRNGKYGCSALLLYIDPDLMNVLPDVTMPVENSDKSFFFSKIRSARCVCWCPKDKANWTSCDLFLPTSHFLMVTHQTR